jgi:CRP-like cAMP-binding protein
MDTGLLVMGDLSQRLHQLIMEIERLSLLNGRMRIATYVLDQYLLKGRIFTLEVPKNAVASLLALKPESFSRLLKELTENGIIKVDDNKIEVLDDHLLRKYAGIS